MPEKERSDFFLYVDEFQSFVSNSLSTILSEDRKYRLCLTHSHQYGDQLKPEISAAIIGNVGSLVSFRVGHRDAKALGESYPATHFTGMSNFEICAKVLCGGKDLDPFVDWTHPPSGKRHGRARSIRRFE